MAKFAYNNIKNISTNYTPFEFNYSYYSYILYKEEADSWSISPSADKLITKLRNLMTIYRDNLLYAEELQK